MECDLEAIQSRTRAVDEAVTATIAIEKNLTDRVGVQKRLQSGASVRGTEKKCPRFCMKVSRSEVNPYREPTRRRQLILRATTIPQRLLLRSPLRDGRVTSRQDVIRAIDRIL